VLRGVARRPLDIAARYGGEELVAVLPGADREHADHVARALVEAVSGLGVAHEASPTRGCVTASVGAACVEAVRELSNEAALRLADRALYQAKDAGRDRHVLLDPDFTAASPLPRPAA
jgi:diguanylate cyclase (GGDEF)-like protein